MYIHFEIRFLRATCSLWRTNVQVHNNTIVLRWIANYGRTNAVTYERCIALIHG